ncbi:hypothetical protein NA57DRAFT_75555 [Rhizodiscina lignyota]|uniref:SprT-like domain-containing protein n=1 Tax=Rhizodiscina lignyota TaxID=1504668 RepID=A0A9P4IKX8_9PEZI|nr:hypothetical protein NA57DRAFT_75555 [Rhizodiscina lignyota]
MARPTSPSDSEDDLPSIADLLNKPSQRAVSVKSKPRLQTVTIKSTANGQQELNGSSNTESSSEHERNGRNKHPSTRLIPKVTVKARANEEGQVRRQRALKGIQGNSVLLPLEHITSRGEEKNSLGHAQEDTILRKGEQSVRQTPSRRAKRTAKYEQEVLDEVQEMELSRVVKARSGDEGEDSESSTEEDDSIALINFWSGRNPSPSKAPGRRKKSESQSPPPSPSPRRRAVKRPIVNLQEPGREVVDLVSPNPKKLPERPLQLPSDVTASRPSSSSDNDRAAILTFDPPKSRSPHKAPPLARPVTPPATTPPPSPSNSRLTSPSKKNRIPHAPFRPSIDAFWSATVINEWNDQYSPTKDTLTSPRKKNFGGLVKKSSSSGSDGESPSPTKSPRKSPTKKDPAVVKARKDFEAGKHNLADIFLKDLDEKITGGKIAELTAATGGVKIVWSKKLNTTAGRANWKRETIRKTAEDGSQSVIQRHHASIEFAEKVIDDEQRLLNTLAHEFCHLANYMISGVRGNPHGKEFKEWGRKVEGAFSSRGVEVTTKHHYEIEYKYIWECIVCGCAYKRHSKSIDPARHSCGKCKAKLVQTKPPVRNIKTSEYQLFVKEHFQTVKKANPSANHGAVMEMIGKMYRARKDGNKSPPDSTRGSEQELDDVVKAIGVICLDD